MEHHHAMASRLSLAATNIRPSGPPPIANDNAGGTRNTLPKRQHQLKMCGLDPRERSRTSSLRPVSSPRSRPSPNMQQGRSRSQPREKSMRSSARAREPMVQNGKQERPQSRHRQHAETRSGCSSDPASPFDANGYCFMHPDVMMAKKRGGGGWRIRLEQCPKCMRKSSRDTESLTSDDSRGDHRRPDREPNSHQRDRQNSFRSRSSAKSQTNTSGQARGQNERRRNKSDVNHSRSLRSHPDQCYAEDYDREIQCRSQRRNINRQEERDERLPRSRSPPRRSLSRSFRRGHGEQRQRMDIVQVRRTVCVDGRPFDKNGRCFAHPHIKVASKKILGGWKMHMEFCLLCLNGDAIKKDDHASVDSDTSRLTDGSGLTVADLSHRSQRSSRSSRFPMSSQKSHASVSSRKSNTSLGSKGSARSTSSWSSKRSSKKKVESKDDSFLPLDGDGYCLHHPDVQLAKISKKRGWQVIMDFCPECAGQSLAMCGSVSGSKPRKRRTSLTSANSSCKSGKSGSSHIESMPYIDGDGKPGHYSGHVDNEGQPNGRGKMKYISGSKFDGVWHEGTKLHGRSSKKKSPKNQSRHPPPPPPPPPPLVSSKRQGRRSKTRHSPDDNAEDYKSSHRTSRRDTQSRSHNDEEDSISSVRRPTRRSLSRLRQKCDEIESLLRGYPSSTRETKHE